MATLDSVSQSFSLLKIKPTAEVVHAATTSDAAWREALQGAEGVPDKFELLKTLVFKPKTAKTATPIPVVVVAREETQTNSGALGKKLNLKELRMAPEDLLKEFFALDKNARA